MLLKKKKKKKKRKIKPYKKDVKNNILTHSLTMILICRNKSIDLQFKSIA